MGGLCSKEGGDAFSSPGRQLGGGDGSSSAQGPPASGGRSKIPNTPKVKGPGRQLSNNIEGSGTTPSDPREAARLAAQARQDKAAKGKGNLGQKLAAENSGNALAKASEQERAQRDLDASAKVLAYD